MLRTWLGNDIGNSGLRICYIDASNIEGRNMNTVSSNMKPSAHGTAWSVLHLRCPRCHHGHVYKGVFATNIKCPVCDMRFEREPGYFIGAMYISYALASVVLGGLLAALYAIFPAWHDITIFALGCVAFLPFVPIIYRYSRVVWMTMDRAFDP
jgi:uncharacterized protein (DUF983 family)